jgi:hypothetical protein
MWTVVARVGLVVGLANHVAPRRGVALAGLFHASAHQLLEVLLLRHCPTSSEPNSRTPRVSAFRHAKAVDNACANPPRTTLEDIDPLYPRNAGQRGWPV